MEAIQQGPRRIVFRHGRRAGHAIQTTLQPSYPVVKIMTRLYQCARSEGKAGDEQRIAFTGPTQPIFIIAQISIPNLTALPGTLAE